jgi:hypothetical protein
MRHNRIACPRRAVVPAAGLAAAVVLAAGGCQSPEIGEAPAGSWTAPRLSVNGRALYALPELAPLAAELVRQIAGMRDDRPPRVAFYYVTSEGRKDRLGESIAQDLATLMARDGRGSVEVYTRRKLARVLEEMRRQMSDLFDEAEIARLGKLSGVDAVIAGRLVREADAILLNVQILSVETGRIAGGQTLRLPLGEFASSEPILDLPGAATRLSQEVAGGLDAGTEWKIAIYDLTRGAESFSLGAEVAEVMGTELSRGHAHIVPLTRKRLGEVLEEQQLQRSDLFDEGTCARLAKLMGGNAVLTGFGEIYRDFYALNVQVIEVESARIQTGAFALLQRKPGAR